MRTVDMQPDDFEGMMGVCATMITTAMNHHQRAMGQMRTNGQFPPYTTPIPYSQPTVTPVSYCHPYPPAYSQYGYCYAHGIPYLCEICSKYQSDVLFISLLTCICAI